MPPIIPGVSSFRDYAAAWLHVRPKRGAVVPFRLNAAQERLEREVDFARAEGRPVRFLILKARQLGFSTWALGRQYEYATTRFGVSALMAAHDDDSTKDLFERLRLMHDLSPNPPMTRYSSKKELDFANPNRRNAREEPGLNSKIVVATAGRGTMGRSRTLRFVHGSEVAFWENAGRVLLAVEQTLPDDPDTFEILESTANGVGGEFFDRWQLASDPATRGIWRALFFPWFDDPEYAMDLVDGVMNPIPPCIEDHGAFVAEEGQLAALHGLTDRQLNWRRYAIVNKCGNDMMKFRQEYPADPMEAFLVSGRPIFNRERLRARERFLSMEDARRSKELMAPRWVRGDVVRSGGRATWASSADGPLSVYRWPSQGREYVVGGDPCKGVVRGKNPDSACLQVIDRHSWEQVAVWHGRVEAPEFARKMELVGYFWNRALLVPEANDHGHTVCVKLEEWSYPNLFLRHEIDMLGHEPLKRTGWENNSKTRPVLVDTITAGLNDGLIVLHDVPTIAELTTFVRNEKSGKAEADANCHDDRVIALGLALCGIHFYPAMAKASKFPDPAHVHPDVMMIARFLEKVRGEVMEEQRRRSA